MNRLDKLAFAAVIITTLLCVRGTVSIFYVYNSVQPIFGTKLMIGFSGWFIATYGPIAIAVWFWRWAKHIRASWVLHLLFLPCAFTVLRAGEALMLYVIGDPDFDATLGGPVMQAYLLFIVAAVGYFAAVVSKRRSVASDRA